MALAVAILVSYGLATALPAIPGRRYGGHASWMMTVLATGLGVALAVRTFLGHRWVLSLGTVISPIPGLAGGPTLVLDRLGALFLLLICVVAIPALLVGFAWWRRTPDLRVAPAAVALTMLACFTVVTAADVWSLLIGWEGVTLAFYWLSGMQRSRPGRIRAALFAVGFGKVSGACLTAGLLLLVAGSRSVQISHLGAAPEPARDVAYVLLVLAFAVKVGLVPLHVWLPRSYAAAPGPLRALLAGVAVNVGFYGLWRTLDVLGAPPAWLADVVMVLGALSAIVGIAHAAVQARLTRIIAYSSVENAGLIVAAYGFALVGASLHRPAFVAAGLLAATLQVIGHAVAKTLLFTTAGTIAAALDTDDLAEVRGVARLFPWSGTGLGVGAATIAGLPPGVIFVSEWFILETLMQQFRLTGDLQFALPMAVTGALVALTSGFAGVAFVRVIGFGVLGHTQRRWRPHEARDFGWDGRLGVAALILACVGIAAATPWEIRLLAQAMSSLVPPRLMEGAASGTVLGPVFANFSVLDPTSLVVELLVLLALVVLGAWLLSGRRLWTVRTVEPWRSATGGVSGADEYTPYGYANPTRHVLANLLRPTSRVRPLTDAEREELGGPGAQLAFEADVVEVTESYLYRPLRRALGRLVGMALKLQNGRLDVYLLYMLSAVVGVIIVVGVLA